MKKQSVKRVNVYLTNRELDAIERLMEEVENRKLEMNMSDVIREAINDYAEKMTGFKGV